MGMLKDIEPTERVCSGWNWSNLNNNKNRLVFGYCPNLKINIHEFILI